MSETPAKYEVATRADAVPATVPDRSAPDMLELIRAVATTPDANMDALERLEAMYERSQDRSARSAFNAAVVKFQQSAPIIEKADKAYDKAYARMDRIWREIRPLMRECGLAITWESADPDGGTIVLVGHMRHSAGHSEPLRYVMPLPEAMKGMNSAQQYGSATTYAKRYATCAALGIQTGDDDDGHCAAPPALLDDGAAAELAEALRGLPEDRRTAFWAWISRTAQREISAPHDIPRALYKQAMRAIEKAKGGAK